MYGEVINGELKDAKMKESGENEVELKKSEANEAQLN